MRFRQSIKLAARPLGTTEVAQRLRRRRLPRLVTRRGLVLTTLLLIGAGFILADRAMLAADGIIAGDLTAVSPILTTRVTRLHAQCLDRVEAGAILAELENEVTIQTSAQTLSQIQLQASQTRARIEILTHEANAARKLYEAQLALRDQLKLTYEAQAQLMKKDFIAALQFERAKSELIRADAEAQAANLNYQGKLADQKKTELDTDLLWARIREFETSPEMMGHFVLRAPKAGILTQCDGHVGEIMEPRDSLFRIFSPETAYALAFFHPDDLRRLPMQREVSVSITGIEKPVHARVVGYYPELAGLPQNITRYFWQQERWSQYVAVRLDFTDLAPAQRNELRAGARIEASVWLRPSFVSPDMWSWLNDKVVRIAALSRQVLEEIS